MMWIISESKGVVVDSYYKVNPTTHTTRTSCMSVLYKSSLQFLNFNSRVTRKHISYILLLTDGVSLTILCFFSSYIFRPAPFFMLDEVDAALDKVNIARVCQYIRSRSRGGKLQSIVISLKDDFYDKADALVGVYRDVGGGGSKAATLDLQVVHETSFFPLPAYK